MNDPFRTDCAVSVSARYPKPSRRSPLQIGASSARKNRFLWISEKIASSTVDCDVCSSTVPFHCSTCTADTLRPRFFPIAKRSFPQKALSRSRLIIASIFSVASKSSLRCAWRFRCQCRYSSCRPPIAISPYLMKAVVEFGGQPH